MGAKWTAADMPDLGGRRAVVTGSNSGLGLEAARELARAGAEVVIACRNQDKGEAAVEQIRASVPEARLELERLDLGDLESVRDFAGRAGERPLDLLVNNAGVMAPPYRTTIDGFESQIGTNHLGHFALTGRLLGALLRSDDPRVVTVSSFAHKTGRMNFDDLMSERRYQRWLAYGQSKLANLLFAFELDRRARAAGVPLRSMAAHPGYSATNLQFAGPDSAIERAVMQVTNIVYAQGADKGALPTLYAATVEELPGGSFVGPDGFMEGRGHPKSVRAAGRAYKEADAAKLWEVSEELTGVRFEFRAKAPAP